MVVEEVAGPVAAIGDLAVGALVAEAIRSRSGTSSSEAAGAVTESGSERGRARGGEDAAEELLSDTV